VTRNQDYVASEIYAKHLFGDGRKYLNNSAGTQTGRLERMYRRILSERAMNRFKWYGLPRSVDPRFLEYALFYDALAVFFYDEDYNKFMALRGGSAGPINVMDNPTHFYVSGSSYTGKRLTAFPSSIMDDEGFPQRKDAECVPIWANYLRVPDLDIVMIYARELAEIDTTISINTKNARRPKIIMVGENQRMSANAATKQIDNGEPVISINTNGGMDLLPTALDLGINPDSLEKLHILRTRKWNECMTLLGIDNANQDKKERLVASEVDANDGQIQSSAGVALNARQHAAEEINRRWPMLKLSVEFDPDITGQMESAIDDPDMSEKDSEDE